MEHPKLEFFNIGKHEPTWIKKICQPFVALAHDMDRTLPNINGPDGKDDFFVALREAMYAAVRVERGLRKAREDANGPDWPGGRFT